jgi:SAM-dependent methyltransferase
VYEVPISYTGGTYTEGKKINWKDGMAALWTILRYNIIDTLTDSGETTLRRVSRLSRYNAWLWEQVSPYTGQRILEAGAGIGTMTQYLLSREVVLATDIIPHYLERLRAIFNGCPNVVVQPLDLAAPLPERLKDFHFDTVLCLNVLEHIEEDEAALERFSAVLAKGGRVVLIVPALKRLYGEIDKAVGHYRRYEGAEIKEKLRKAGFHVEETHFFNTLGIPGWYLNSCLLKRKTVPGLQARLNNLLVPLLKLEYRLHPPWGMSLLAVGRRA